MEFRLCVLRFLVPGGGAARRGGPPTAVAPKDGAEPLVATGSRHPRLVLDGAAGASAVDRDGVAAGVGADFPAEARTNQEGGALRPAECRAGPGCPGARAGARS